MAILEKEVWVGLKGNVHYYENLGYEIPRNKDNRGRLTVSKGTKILIKIEDLPKRNHSLVTKICDDCGKKVPNIKYNQILISRKNGDGKDRCENCGHKYGGKSRKNNIPFENSLEHWARINNKNYLLEEFSDDNDNKPNKIAYATHDEYIWNCPKCKSEYNLSVASRTSRNQNCPYCAGQKVNHTNCLWTTHPEIAILLENKEIGYEITSGMGRREIFICPDCGNRDSKFIYSITNKGFRCSKCSDGLSYPEKFMINLLTQLSLRFESQKTFNWSKNKRYDFYIPSINVVIETHGIQHYENSNRGRTLMEEQENDKLKEQLAKANGIDKYIIIDCKLSEVEYIKESILNSELCILFNLMNINWMDCHSYACRSLVKTICDLWNSGINNTELIGKKLNLDRNTISKYLKQGNKLGWCDYDPKEEMKKNGQRQGKTKKKSVVQLTKDESIVRKWNSIKEAELELNIFGISFVCSGKRNNAGGFKWMYKEDYEKMINNQKSSNYLLR